jgi:hypothetical protein
MWVRENPDVLFYYKESGFEVGGDLLGCRNIPFTIGIQSPWQVVMMQQYGHQSVVAIHVTFGTNENKVNCFTITYVNVSKPRKPLKHDETQL